LKLLPASCSNLKPTLHNEWFWVTFGSQILEGRWSYDYFHTQTSQLNPRTISIPGLLAWIICCITLVPPILGRGGFFDGLLYASISRNLSMQEWHSTQLTFSDTFYNEFSEHPPFMFWIGSWWFRLMGDHAWTEKSFALVIAVGLLLGFYHFWKKQIPGRAFSYGWGWWMLLWCLVSGPLWGLGQFILENPLTLFTFLAVWSAMNLNHLYAGFGLGLFTWLAFITKGPPALFPIAAPWLLWICRLRSTRETVRIAAWSSFVLGILSVFGWLWLPLRSAMLQYWRAQVQAVFNGDRPPNEYGSEHMRIDMAFTFIQQMLIPILLLLLCYLFYKFRTSLDSEKISEPFDNLDLKKRTLFFAFVAFSASAPLFISPKLLPHYLIPSYPWWTLAMTTAALPFLRQLPFHTYNERKLKHRIILNISAFVFVLICLVYALTKRNVPVRDFSLQHDIKQVVELLKRKEQKGKCSGIAISSELHGQHSTWAYFQRYYQISLFTNPMPEHCLILKGKESQGPEGFRLISNSTSNFDIYTAHTIQVKGAK